MSLQLRTTFQLLEAQSADALRLSRFAVKVFHETFAKDNRPEDIEAYMAQSFNEIILRSELNNPQRHTVLALSGQEIAGYYQLIKDEFESSVQAVRPIELRRFYVDHKWHGLGLAHFMMESLLSESTRQGFSTMWLGVWEQNFRAQKFYQKWKFREVGSHDFVMGTDVQRDLIFSREL